MNDIFMNGTDADLAYRRERLHAELVDARLRREARLTAKAGSRHHARHGARRWLLRGSGAWHVAQ